MTNDTKRLNIKSNNLNDASVKSSPNSQVTKNTVKITFGPAAPAPCRPSRSLATCEA